MGYMTILGRRIPLTALKKRYRTVGATSSVVRPVVLCLFLFTLVVALFTPVSAETVTVCASGCDNTTIQDAVDYASSGDTISVGSGIYTEQVLIDKPLNLIGTDAEIRLPDSGLVSHNWNSGNYPTVGVDTATGVNISGFVINSTGHDTGSYSGVHFWKSSGNVSNCIFYGYQDAVISNHVWDVSYPTHVDITYNQFNVCPSGCNGITCTEMDADCYIYGNTVEGVATSNIGIQVGYGATGDIISNDVSGISDSECIMLSGGVDGSTISYNTIDNCESGIFLYYDGSYGYGGNDNTDILHNTISDCTYGIYIEEDSINTTVGWNNLTGCDTNIQSEETVIFTVGDNICEGLICNSFFYGFENEPDWVEEREGFVEYNSEIVDTTYNSNINGTAWHFNLTSNSTFAITVPNIDFRTWELNRTIGFPVNTVSFKIYNYTLLGDNLNIVLWFQHISEEENGSYGFRFPAYSIEEKDGYSELLFSGIDYCNFENYTSGEEELSVSPCPLEMEEIDHLQIHIFGYSLDVDFVLDDMVVYYAEISANSPDCATPVSNISYMYENLDVFRDKYVRFNAISVSGSGVAQFSQRILMQSNMDYLLYFLKDSSTTKFVQSNSGEYGVRLVLNNQTFPDYYGKLLDVVGYLHTSLGDLYPEDMYLELYNITVIGNAPESYLSYDTYPDFITNLQIEPITNSYGLTKVNVNPPTIIYHYTRFNQTHTIRTNLKTGAVNIYELDEIFKETSVNYSSYIYLFPNFEGYQDGTRSLYIFTDEFEDALNFTETKTVIIKGTVVNQSSISQGGDFVYFWMFNIDYTNHDNMLNFDIVGDGICGSLETGYPVTAWNYSPDCKGEGLTGFMVVTTNMAVALFGVFLLIGVIFAFSGGVGLDLGDMESLSRYLLILIVASLIILTIIYMQGLG